MNINIEKKKAIYNLAIVAIAKNEKDYLREWVAFHKVVGVDKIFLYDNDSTDGMTNTITDFIDNDYVTLKYIKGSKQMFNAYNDALFRFGNLCKYMAFIDCDEFLLPSYKGDDIVSILDSIISTNPRAGGVAVNWRIYGSSGYDEKPNGLCIENFVWRSYTETGIGNQCIKSIVMPKYVRKFMHSHYPRYKFLRYNVNQLGKPVFGYRNKPHDEDKLRINHYFTKSRKQWIERRSLGKVDADGQRPFSDFIIHNNNDIKDLSASMYSEEVKKIINMKFHKR